MVLGLSFLLGGWRHPQQQGEIVYAAFMVFAAGVYAPVYIGGVL